MAGNASGRDATPGGVIVMKFSSSVLARRVRLADGSTLARQGPGAGRWVTAQSLLADVLDLPATRRLD